MKILAFDCAGAQCAAAVTVDGATLASEALAAGRGQAQTLIPLLQSVLGRAAFAFADIDRFAVTTGPGSFTGIRVALAAARGLALATGQPVVGVTCFEAHAAMIAGSPIPRRLVAIESRRAACFLQILDHAGMPLGPPGMVEPGEVASWAGAGPILLAGDAAWRLAPFLPDAVMADTPPEIDPAIVAAIAAGRPAGRMPAPFYIRPPDAAPRPGSVRPGDGPALDRP